jgi:hypothetical protein
MFMFQPTFIIASRQTYAITRIDWAWSAWQRFGLGHCATWFAPVQTAGEAI